MLDGKRFLPPTGTPNRNKVFSKMRFELWLPLPLTVATVSTKLLAFTTSPSSEKNPVTQIEAPVPSPRLDKSYIQSAIPDLDTQFTATPLHLQQDVRIGSDFC